MLTISFTGVDGKIVRKETLTAGMVGRQVMLEFSPEWDGLSKTVVFSAGSVTRDAIYTGGPVTIPAEVLAKPLMTFWVGVYGVSADGQVVIPTVRTAVSVIQPGADPSGDPGTVPDLPVWAQLQTQLDKTGGDITELQNNISGISVLARYVSSKGYVLSIDTNAMKVRIPKGYVFLKRPRVGQSRLTVEETICTINTESEFSFVAMNVLTTREVVSINPANFDATTQVVLAVLWNRHYTDPAANWIMGPYQVDGEMYNDPAQCSSADEVAALASKASNIGPFITIHDTVLDIVGDSITVNTGYIYARDTRISIPQTTVERNAESSMCLLVYDRSDSAVKCISGWDGLSDTQILIAAISKLYPGNENANYIPGKWSVDGVVYPKVAMEDVEERLDALEANQTPPGTSGLNWYALGDSITRGMYGFVSGDGAGVDLETCWANLAAQYNGWTLTNKGVSGSGYLVQGGTAPKANARQQVDGIDFSGVDLVTLAYGVNDYFQNHGAGTMEDDVATGGTFTSNMRYCIEKIMTDNPTAKIVVISPINTNRGSADTNWAIGKANNAGATLEDFYNAEKAVCEYYGIEFIDMLHSSVVNRKNITTALPDGVHPSRAIHKQMARELSRKIMGA